MIGYFDPRLAAHRGQPAVKAAYSLFGFDPLPVPALRGTAGGEQPRPDVGAAEGDRMSENRKQEVAPPCSRLGGLRLRRRVAGSVALAPFWA